MSICVSGITIRKWRPCLEDAAAFVHLMGVAQPRHPLPSPEEMLISFPRMIEGCEEGALLAFAADRLVGALFLSTFQRKGVGRLIGGVHPDARCLGIGNILLERVTLVAREVGCEALRVRWYLSNPDSESFMNSAGFVEQDKVFWSRLDLGEPLKPWAVHKQAKVASSGIRIVTGREYESIRPDWDRVWWRLLMDTFKDIPSVIPFTELPFEKWRPFLDEPFMDRSLALMALDGDDLAGLLVMGKPEGGTMNIGQTNVARPYRRRGISTALKCAAVTSARAAGGQFLTTQNHEHNPMYALNRAFGFEYIDSHVDALKSL